jgi:hypothetical protein
LLINTFFAHIEILKTETNPKEYSYPDDFNKKANRELMWLEENNKK